MRGIAWIVVMAMLGDGVWADDLPPNTGEIKALTAKQAKTLAKQQGSLGLMGVTELSPEAAEELGKHKGGPLHLDSLAEISGKVAKELGKHRGSLFLDGLKELSPEAAEGLSKHEGYLSLNGLTTISGKAAKDLGRHKGELLLNNIRELSPEAAKGLAKHRGYLHLLSLRELSDEAAKALAKHESLLFFGDNLHGLSYEAHLALWSKAKVQLPMHLSRKPRPPANKP